VAIVNGIAEQVAELNAFAGKVREGEPYVALALVGCVVDGDDQTLAIAALPTVCDEAVGRPVAVPSGGAFEQLPGAAAHAGFGEHDEQLVVKRLELLVGGLVRPAPEVGRDPLFESLEL